jgi:protocatechuate 3,4-dioxygenase alpha subunit
MPEPTPPQTVGPFFAIGLPWPDGPDVVARGSQGAIALRGTVYDGRGEPVPDALVETWQPPEGCRGFGRCPTDAAGRWEITTRKPEAVGVPTRVYFPDEPEANAADPLLSALSETERATLLAAPAEGGYTLDIHLQGPHETVFFAV